MIHPNYEVLGVWKSLPTVPAALACCTLIHSNSRTLFYHIFINLVAFGAILTISFSIPIFKTVGEKGETWYRLWFFRSLQYRLTVLIFFEI